MTTAHPSQLGTRNPEPGTLFHSWISLGLAVLLMFGSSWIGVQSVWAAPQSKKVIRVAQADTKSSDNADVESSSAPKSTFPKGAWVVESIGAAVAALGFVMIGLSPSFINTAKKLEEDAINAGKLEDVPTAGDVQAQNNVGNGLIVGGAIAAGVGVTMMVIGAIWLLAHKPKSAPLPPMDDNKKATLIPSASQSRTILSLQ